MSVQDEQERLLALTSVELKAEFEAAGIPELWKQNAKKADMVNLFIESVEIEEEESEEEFEEESDEESDEEEESDEAEIEEEEIVAPIAGGEVDSEEESDGKLISPEDFEEESDEELISQATTPEEMEALKERMGEEWTMRNFPEDFEDESVKTPMEPSEQITPEMTLAEMEIEREAAAIRDLFPPVEDIDEDLYSVEDLEENIILVQANLLQALPHTRTFLVKKMEKIQEALERKLAK